VAAVCSVSSMLSEDMRCVSGEDVCSGWNVSSLIVMFRMMVNVRVLISVSGVLVIVCSE